MTQNKVLNQYFEWLYALVKNRKTSHRKLLMHLHDTEFYYIIAEDENRALDGINLRRRFAYDTNTDISYLQGPCSVLEMMIALALRCEETIMEDPDKGDRTSKWFWSMMSSLGLSGMCDEKFDERRAERIVDRFIHRDYDEDGKGGLFTVRHANRDLRDVEIWQQMCWCLDEL